MIRGWFLPALSFSLVTLRLPKGYLKTATMRKICTLYFLLFTVIGYAQKNNTVTIEQALAGRMGCGLVNAKPIRIVDTGVINGNYSPIAKVVSNEKDTSKKVIRMRCRATIFSQEPLIVIDGVPVENKFLASLDLNTLESIDMLKSPTAQALYGYRAAAGVIIITTKKTAHWKVFVRDRTDNKPIPGATVQVKNRKKNKVEYLVANDSGFVLLDKRVLYDSVISVSAIGFLKYTDAARIGLNNLSSTILLNRDTKVCEEVAVRTNVITCTRRVISCGFYCLTSGIRITGTDTIASEKAALQKPDITVYPNPAQRNSSVNIKIENATNPPVAIKVTAANGSTIHTQRITATGKNNTLLLQTGNWPAGIYFIQVLYANGQSAGSERLIIQ